MEKYLLTNEQFGPLLPLIEDELITDINWNGNDLVIDHLKKGRYIDDLKLEASFINQFTAHVSNVEGKNFNRYNPLLEAEANGLRISIMHEERAITGRSISIRKSPPVKRLNDEIMIGTDYCDQDTLNLLKNCVKAHFNIVNSGLTGSGKTELLKYLTGYIPDMERTITIEDNAEIHYREINPNKDCVAIIVDDKFNYTDAIKACLRMLPTWILLSEARSVEVQYLIESISTGHYCLTTIHSDDVRKIPSRIKNMVEDPLTAERIENDVFTFLDLGVMIRKKITPKGIIRYIDQIACYSMENEEKVTHMIVQNGKIVSREFPKEIQAKFSAKNIKNPFVFEN